MKARLDRKAKILTAAVLCACTTLWANSVWAANVYYGGKDTSVNGAVEDKEITIENGNYNGIYGGYAFEETMGWSGNAPKLEGTSKANNNIVTINGGTITSAKITEVNRNCIVNGVIAAAWSNYASGNKVIMNGGIFQSNLNPKYADVRPGVYGALVMVNHNANDGNRLEIVGNHVEFNGGKVTNGDIAGVYVNSAREHNNNNDIKQNGVTIGEAGKSNYDDIEINGNIYGAVANDENAFLTENKVIINGGHIVTDSGEYEDESAPGIYGAYAQSKNSNVTNNTVIINGGKIEGTIYGAAYANSTGEPDNDIPNGNTVILNGGEIIGDIYAAVSQNDDKVFNNKIEVNYSENIKDKLNLKQANLFGAYYYDNVKQKKINLDIFGYKGEINSIAHFSDVNIENGKDVTIKGVNKQYDNSNEDREGNYHIDNFVLNNTSLNITDEIRAVNNIESKNNSIFNAEKVKEVNIIKIINSEADISLIDDFGKIYIENKNNKNVNLGEIKGCVKYPFKTSTITTDSKFTADSIKDLKELNVDMTAINWEKDSAVIDVSGTADLTGTAISATGTLAAAAGTEVQNGDAMSFIKAGTLTGAKAEDINIDNLQIGFATEAQVEVQDGDNSIDFVISGAQQATEQVSIIGESRTAAIAFVNQGSDILNNAFGLMDDGKYGIKTFAAAHGNYSKYETGSHIRVNGWSMLAGVGSSEKVNDGAFSWGVFFENGSGNYRTYNDYNGFNLEGFGSAVYNGGGALARYRSNAGNYAEVGVRAGMLKNSLSNAVADGFGVQGGYDEETSYYGAHVGAGHIFTLDDHSSLDVYGKYFYTHHDSDEFEILGDEVRFDSADSSRLRLGMRYNQNDGNAFSHYYGLAWDYEFNGDADVTAAGFDTGNPSLKGSTAVIEAGIHYAPDKSPWSVDLGLQGYGGQRDGFSGTMQVNYSF